MKFTRRALCLLVVPLAVLIAACGGGGDSKADTQSLDEYFKQVAVVGNEFLAALALPTQANMDAPVGTQANMYQEFAQTLAQKVGGAKDKLDGLHPPPEVTDGHAELVASVDHARDVLERLADDLGRVQSVQDLQEIAGRPDALEAFERFRAACRTLRQIAVENNVAVDLTCDGQAPLPGG